MRITKEEVLYVARLANLELGAAETDRFAAQLSDILEHIEALNEVATDAVEPMSQVMSAEGTTRMAVLFREDLPQPSVGTESALSNAPERGDAYFKVPKVIADR